MTSLLVVAGCLPGDLRPEPGELLIEAEASDDVREGFVTDDGWTLRFDRFVTTLAGLGLGDDVFDQNCIDYSSSAYGRLFDFSVADTSKLNLHYGLGNCTLRYRIGSPRENTLLTPGTTEADRELMRLPRDDDGLFVRGGDGSVLEGVGLLLEGSAIRDGDRKDFRWLIRQNQAITRCFDAERNPFKVRLGSGDTEVRRARIRPRELFRLFWEPDEPIVFAHFAASDADGDGVVTLEEMENVVLMAEPILSTLLGDLVNQLPEATRNGRLTLREVLEKTLFPRLASFVGASACEFAISDITIQSVDRPGE